MFNILKSFITYFKIKFEEIKELDFLIAPYLDE